MPEGVVAGPGHTRSVAALAEVPREPLRSLLALLFNPSFPVSGVHTLRQGPEMWGQPLMSTGVLSGVWESWFCWRSSASVLVQTCPPGLCPVSSVQRSDSEQLRIASAQTPGASPSEGGDPLHFLLHGQHMS